MKPTPGTDAFDLEFDPATSALVPLVGPLLDALADGLLLFDRRAELIACNEAAPALLGLTEAQLRRRAPLPAAWTLVDEEGAPAGDPMRVVRRVLRSGLPSPDRTVGLRRPDAGTVWLEVAVQPLVAETDDAADEVGAGSAAGRPDGAVVTLRDVTRARLDGLRLDRYGAFRRELIGLIEASLQGGLDATFYQRTLETAARVIPGAQAGSLVVRDDADRFRFEAAVNFDLGLLRQSFLYGHELHRDLLDPAPRLIHGFDDSAVEVERRDPIYLAGPTDRIVATLSVPVVLDGRAVAFFNLDNFEERDAFESEAIEMARIFAVQIGALWRRFRLERDLRDERATLEHLALHDSLTGLPNRELLRDRIDRAIRQTSRSDRSLALLFLDLDHFKRTNDALGHDVGDDLLRAVAARLGGLVREADTVARWGGDEFVVLLTNLARIEDAAVVAQKILRELGRPFELRGHVVRTGVSIGVDVYPYRASGPDDLVKHADIALHRAKATGRDGFVFFTEEMNEQLHARLRLEAELRQALVERSFLLHYQPRVELTSGRITSVEALVRWNHPALGMVPPDRFIPLAEETGLILELGRQVLDMACAQARAWQDEGIDQRVAVNISTVQLAQPDLVDTVDATLRRYALSPDRLEIEITESTAMSDVETSVATLRGVEALGVTVALDDFGTAYSSLGYLSRLPLASLKIDRSFIGVLPDDVHARPTEVGIVQAVVALGRSLGFTLVGEGVESEAQCRFLAALGCQEAQGYFFSRPCTAEELRPLLGAGRVER